MRTTTETLFRKTLFRKTPNQKIINTPFRKKCFYIFLVMSFPPQKELNTKCLLVRFQIFIRYHTVLIQTFVVGHKRSPDVCKPNVFRNIKVPLDVGLHDVP